MLVNLQSVVKSSLGKWKYPTFLRVFLNFLAFKFPLYISLQELGERGEQMM